MATPADSEAAKSLNNSPGKKKFVFNNSPGKKKFVFKNFSQRISDIDINVFRSVDRVKAEPILMEQKNREIIERLVLETAAEVAKKKALKDDHDDIQACYGTQDLILEGQAPSRGGE